MGLGGDDGQVVAAESISLKLVFHKFHSNSWERAESWRKGRTQCVWPPPLGDEMADDRVKSPFSCDVDHNLYGHFMARRRRRGTLMQGGTVSMISLGGNPDLFS